MKTAFLLVVLSFFAATCFARINFLEPYRPGVDTSLRDYNDYTLSLDVSGNSDNKLPNLFSMPAIFTYGISTKMETGLSMGLVSYTSQSGVSDIEFGIKYLFEKGICGEFGFLLPTADYRRGLGLGSISIKMQWLIERDLKTFTGFGGFGYNIVSSNLYDPSAISPGNSLTYRLGVQRPITPTLKGYIELKGINHTVSYKNGTAVNGSAYNEIYLAPGINYRTESLFDFNASLLVGLSSDSNDIIFFVGMDFK